MPTEPTKRKPMPQPKHTPVVFGQSERQASLVAGIQSTLGQDDLVFLMRKGCTKKGQCLEEHSEVKADTSAVRMDNTCC